MAYWAVSACEHRICSVCCLRLRALYGTRACPICKAECDWVVIGAAVREGSYQQCMALRPSPNLVNAQLQIQFLDAQAKDCCQELLQLRCPYRGGSSEATCREHCKNKDDLQRHVQRAHNLFLCDICVEHRKCFSIEHYLYSRSALLKHQKEGDGAGPVRKQKDWSAASAAPTGPAQSTPFKGHPPCTVCHKMFYSDDELFEHCRSSHELCHICQRLNKAKRYFRDYSHLEDHFAAEHYTCPEPVCRELKFVVFETDTELKLHMAQVHVNTQKMQRSHQQQLHRINVSFQVSSRNQDAPASPSPRSGPRAANLAPVGPASQQPAPAPAPVPQLTKSQREQIASNFLFGSLPEDLTSRLQSLSLYQQRNDQFLEAMRTVHHLNADQRAKLQEAAREYQGNELAADRFVLKVESVVGSVEALQRLYVDLVALQLDAEKQRRLKAAFEVHLKKMQAFPALKAAAPKKAAGSSAAEAKSKAVSTGTGKGAPRSAGLFDAPGMAKVLQIVPSTRSTAFSATGNDPMKNPALLFSATLTGSRGIRRDLVVKRPEAPVPIAEPVGGSVGGKAKMKAASFNVAALGRAVTLAEEQAPVKAPAGRGQGPRLSEKEFPSLSRKDADAAGTRVEDEALLPWTGNAFTSDMGGIESFTIGGEAAEAAAGAGASVQDGKRKKKGRTVLRFGQQWDV